MNFLQAIIVGLVEGVTEFLPISSTFHQIFTAKLLGIPQTDFVKLFEVFIQVGAIASVAILYWHTIRTDKELVKKTLVAFVPTALIGFAMYKVIKNVFFESTPLMLTVFIGIGAFFIVYEWYLNRKKIDLKKELTSFTYKQAFLIGIIQALAIVPGVSRAGAVLLGMMFLGFKRSESARFSFLLALPTLAAASFYDLFKMRKLLSGNLSHIEILAVGTVAAFISAYVVVKWFITYLQKHSLTNFGWYRILLGILLLFGVK
ncbi:MAG TPA: undecaprenyl-diphosphate phosphatase [Candidatus Eisenbacteria bacterium]|nr:undecaprenyl-diphosphate phosphatase [Candidatus Eisenbacteria bacterium]